MKVLPKTGVLSSFALTQIASYSVQAENAENENEGFLDSIRQGDQPIPIRKSFWELLSENWWVAALVVAGIMSCILAWWIRKRFAKKRMQDEKEKETDPYEEAMSHLQSLEGKHRSMEPKPFTFRLSEVLRVYVQRRFELPAMELTGEEFLREVSQHQFIHSHYEDLLREFIARGDVVKYSREGIDDKGLHMLFESAQHFVKDTNQRLEEERLSDEEKLTKATST